MSEQRARKVPGVEQTGRGRATKGSGDTVLPDIQPNQNVRSKSKRTIPKSLRYDLDNALIGTPEIQVMRRVVRGYKATSDPEQHKGACKHGGRERRSEAPAMRRVRLLPPRPRCCPRCTSYKMLRHLHKLCRHPLPPPVNYVDCSSTRPTASKAQSRKHPSPSCPQDLSLAIHRAFQIQSPCRSSKPKQQYRNRRRQQLPVQEWRVPRLCRTYSLLTSAPRIQPQRRPATEQPRQQTYFFQSYPRRRPRMVDKATQTPAQYLRVRHEAEESMPSPAPAPCLQDPVNVMVSRKEQKKRKAIPHHSIFLQKEPVAVAPCPRCPATTTFFPKESKRHPLPVTPLFQDDLIEILAEKSDKQLKILFKRPSQDESLSTMNLVHTSLGRWDVIKKIPWR